MNKACTLLFTVFLAISAGCQKEQIEASFSLSYESDIKSPIEIPPGKINESADQFLGTTADAETLVFQKTPAIFFGHADSDQTTFCTIMKGNISTEKIKAGESNYDAPFSFHDQETGSLVLREGDRPILAYQYEQILKNRVPRRYKRSTYVHPLYDLRGTVLTEDFPIDHYHHRGLSWNWPKVWVNEKRYDLWHIHGPRNEFKGLYQIFDKWTLRETGPVCALLGIQNHWETEDKQKVMDEDVLFRVFRQADNARAIDVKLTWTAIEPIKISGQDVKGYGGFNLRFAPRENTQITSQAGPEASDSNLRTYAWIDFSAQFAGQSEYSGAAIFQHPYNPDFPAGWCLRYYGFIGVAWPGLKVLELGPGESFTLTFRLYVHDGDVDQGLVEQAYNAYQGQLMLED